MEKRRGNREKRKRREGRRIGGKVREEGKDGRGKEKKKGREGEMCSISYGDENSMSYSYTYPVDKHELRQARVGVLHPAEGVHHLPAIELLHHLLQAPFCSSHKEDQR